MQCSVASIQSASEGKDYDVQIFLSEVIVRAKFCFDTLSTALHFKVKGKEESWLSEWTQTLVPKSHA